MEEFRLVIWGMHGIYGAGKTMDETFSLIETVELTKRFNLNYRKDILNLREKAPLLGAFSLYAGRRFVIE